MCDSTIITIALTVTSMLLIETGGAVLLALVSVILWASVVGSAAFSWSPSYIIALIIAAIAITMSVSVMRRGSGTNKIIAFLALLVASSACMLVLRSLQY